MSDTLTIAIVLQAVGLLLLVAELFVPSHGVLTVAALGCLGGGIYEAFQYGTTFGAISLVGMMVLLPIFTVLAVRIWPRTFVGRRIAPPNEEIEISDSPAYGGRLAGLIGMTGTALTPLRPVGTGDFNGTRVECIAESGMIDRGAKIVALAVQGQSLIVRPA